MKKLLLFFFILTLTVPKVFSQSRDIVDENFKFSFTLPQNWEQKDKKETADKEGISYSFEYTDKKAAVMLLAFRINSVKNLEDFIYIMEKDADINIPAKVGDYMVFDHDVYDGKNAVYKDQQTTEHIYFYRTKLADAPYNFIYMLRFISSDQYLDGDMQAQIKIIADSFKSTLSLD